MLKNYEKFIIGIYEYYNKNKNNFYLEDIKKYNETITKEDLKFSRNGDNIKQLCNTSKGLIYIDINIIKFINEELNNDYKIDKNKIFLFNVFKRVNKSLFASYSLQQKILKEFPDVYITGKKNKFSKNENLFFKKQELSNCPFKSSTLISVNNVKDYFCIEDFIKSISFELEEKEYKNYLKLKIIESCQKIKTIQEIKKDTKEDDKINIIIENFVNKIIEI